MVVYNFKRIQVVPEAKDFIDIVLSKTQRGTPTIIHRQYAIQRIRSFYLRKVKFTQQTFHDRLSRILEDFPMLDDIHPFYAALMNVLYDRDHYKLALGQLNTARHLVDNVARDYTRMLKFGDSLYRCKQLKRAALGRMCTIMKRQAPNLAYLEQVRQHLARLPTIDPNTRTLLVCGYPNVGKSSFVNKLTRANVEVQPYAFTTKSLFVGHTDYQYLRWQVIDTPGILDQPLEARNTIEMQAVTALAHLRACVLFLLDISEECGYSIDQQVSLFQSIRPLFANKPLLIVLTKLDKKRLDQLSPAQQATITSLVTEGTELLSMSNVTDEGVATVKQVACDKLLADRTEVKMATLRNTSALNRLHVAVPTPRDNRSRPACIPPTVLAARAQEQKLTTEEKIRTKFPEGIEPIPHYLRDDPTVFSDVDARDQYLLDNDEWRYDAIPEIVDGRNVADFIDPEILERLDELEREEERLEGEASMGDEEEDGEEEVGEEDETLIQRMKDSKELAKHEHKTKTVRNNPRIPKRLDSAANTLGKFESHLSELGINPERAVARAKERSRSRSRGRSLSESAETRVTGKKRKRSESTEAMEVEGEGEGGDDREPEEHPGFRNVRQKTKAKKLAWRAQRSPNVNARKGEGDRTILNLKPKHLFSGKRGFKGDWI